MENRNGLCADFTIHDPIAEAEPAVALQQVAAHQELHEGVRVKTLGADKAYHWKDFVTVCRAERAGFRALYLSGAGVANASLGMPDLALTTLQDVCEDIRRISQVTSLPLLVDADTGWGEAFMIARTVEEMTRAGAAGCHLEDQVSAKRCGHRPGKQLVSATLMRDRIKAAVNARPDAKFVIMARPDTCASEGLDRAIERAQVYVAAGADMIFAEALTN